MVGVFGDTSAFQALFDAHDNQHQEARSSISRLARQRAPLYTTTFVIAETHALLLSRIRRVRGAQEARRRARQAIEQIYTGTTVIVRPTEADEISARSILQQFDDQDFSFTDATSFAVMRRLGIGVAFTFDDDFGRAGFTDLRHV